MTEPAAGLGSGRLSRTSIMVAAGRTFGAREPDPNVRTPDHLAERFLGPAEREVIREHPIAAALEGDYQQGRQDMQVASTANLMLVRTRFIDGHLLRALERGATQVEILGAGFDNARLPVSGPALRKEALRSRSSWHAGVQNAAGCGGSREPPGSCHLRGNRFPEG